MICVLILIILIVVQVYVNVLANYCNVVIRCVLTIVLVICKLPKPHIITIIIQLLAFATDSSFEGAGKIDH